MRLPLLIILASFSLISLAYDLAAVNEDGATIYYNKCGDSELEVTYAKPYAQTESYQGHLRIPASVTADGTVYQVTSIGMRAFGWCDALIEVSIPSTVMHFGANAFDGCYLLEKVTVAGNALSTDGNAVYSGDQLLGYTPGVVGEYTVAEGTTALGPCAFAACTFLTDVNLPEGLKSIGDNAFYFCNYLNAVNIPASVDYIGHAAFSDCLSLKSINVAADNTAYSSNQGILLDTDGKTLIQSPGGAYGLAFIPDGVTRVGDEAFFRSYGITTVKIPATVTEIAEGAFIDCPRLSSVEIPASVSSIGTLAFAMCPELKNIYVDVADPNDIQLGEGVFAETATANCTLYVPAASVELYASAPQWRDFASVRASSTLVPQQIQWEQITDSIMVGTSMRLNAVSTSQLAVQYMLAPASEQYASIADNVLTVHQPGDITVTAYQPGNVMYAPADPVTHTYKGAVAGLDLVDTDAVIKVYGALGAIVIRNADEMAEAQVYNLSGQLLYKGTDRRIAVPSAGVYIVRIDGKGFKVVTR